MKIKIKQRKWLWRNGSKISCFVSKEAGHERRITFFSKIFLADLTIFYDGGILRLKTSLS